MDIANPIVFLASLLGFITIANNASIITGPLINAGYRASRSKIIASLSIILGAVFFGKLISTPYSCSYGSLEQVSVIIYLATLIPFAIATLIGIPFSLSLAVIASTTSIGSIYNLSIYSWIANVALLWFISAVFSIVLGYYIYRFLRKIASRSQSFRMISFSRISILATSIALGILLGANNLGFISSISCHSYLYIIALAGGISLFLTNISLLEGLFRMISVRYISILSIQISLIVFTLISTILGLPASLVYIQLFTLIGYRMSTILSIGFRDLIYRVSLVWILSIGSSIAVSIILSSITI